jgi:uncharacterized protein YcbK (DUF882 family)
MKYFTINELCKSGTANKYGIKNTPPNYVEKNLIYLIDNVLDVIRAVWGKPIYVTNGYRSPELITAMKREG